MVPSARLATHSPTRHKNRVIMNEWTDRQHFFDARMDPTHAWMMRREQKEGKTKRGEVNRKEEEKNPKNYLKTDTVTIKTKTSFQTSHHPVCGTLPHREANFFTRIRHAATLPFSTMIHPSFTTTTTLPHPPRFAPPRQGAGGGGGSGGAGKRRSAPSAFRQPYLIRIRFLTL